ncbi:response regulator transcription factor [Candidatus Woesearchaeota archaeon]|nr:response regulator transcription factor [Candidatus Woesearchaeota archaeon]
MKILVIEDTELHVEAAAEQLVDHTLSFASSYEEGVQYLDGKKFDVVLTDLLMAKGGNSVMGAQGMKYIFDLLPYGFPLIFLAAKKRVPYIGLVTDVNHHDHPMSACIDPLSSAYWSDGDSQRSLLRINESIVGIFHAPFIDQKKDWRKVLEALLQ